MITVAGGDSFVFGSELRDCGPGWSMGTFPALLSKDSGGYLCVAWPGNGNDAIARSVITACERLKDQNKVVVVSWTFPGRYEFAFSYDTGQKQSPWYSINPWTIKQNAEDIKEEFVTHNEAVYRDQINTINRAKRTGVADFADVFFRHVGASEYWEIYSSLKEIVYLQNYLKVNEIPYLFTCADTILFYNHTVKSSDSNIASLYNQIDFDKWYLFPQGTHSWETLTPRGFYQWAVENKYPVGTTHPLEEAHTVAASLMQEKFNALVKKSL